MPAIDFAKIRPEGGSIADGFEEFCTQIFRHLDGVPPRSTFERFRGAGGDGGAEAIWRLPCGSIWAMQSKCFPGVRSTDKAKYRGSFSSALQNFPGLTRYYICVPFDPAPTVKAKTGTTGGADRLSVWTDELRQLARQTTAHEIEIVWWFSNALKDRLLTLPNAVGRILYWFDSTVIETGAFKTRLLSTERLAGRRYTPDLSLGTDANLFLGAFGRDPHWLSRTADLARRVAEKRRHWSRVTRPKLASDIIAVSARLTEIGEILTDASRNNQFDSADRARLEKAVQEAMDASLAVERQFKAEFDEKHGSEHDTIHFRQFQAEYNAAFPASDLDNAREVSKLLDACFAYAQGWDGQASTEPCILMRGPAGVGKTHAIIDTAKRRAASGALSLVLLGEEILAAGDPWELLNAKLGMSLSASRPELIGALEAAAEASGQLMIIYIDAVNETPGRKRWRSWLPDMLTSFALPLLRICLTCRDIYIDEALGDLRSSIVTYEHQGFAGREYEAATAFATFYELDLPANIIAQPEFANPLFLHLVCRAVKGRGERAIPAGAIALTRLVDSILMYVNQRCAEQVGYDPRVRNPIQEGITALAQRMAAKGALSLPLAEAHSILQTILPSSDYEKSLFRAIEAQDLVAVVELPTGWSVRFAFDRLGDILIARAFFGGMDPSVARDAFSANPLRRLLENRDTISENAGLLQALSIVLPEELEIELIDVVADRTQWPSIAKIMLDALPWRLTESIRETEWFSRCLQTVSDVATGLERLISVASVPRHPFNARFLDRYLSRFEMVDRDVIFGEALVPSWESRGSCFRLVTLIERQNLSALPFEVASLLGITLGWFCSSSDRRIRDRATKALSRLLGVHTGICKILFLYFAKNDDEYIAERLLMAIYAVALGNRDKEVIESCGRLAYDWAFKPETVSMNVLIRDTAHLIIEHALVQGCDLAQLDLSRARPPYTSPWPLVVGEETWQDLGERYPEFPINMFFRSALDTDFARYVVDSLVLNRFDLNSSRVKRDTALRWVFDQVLAFGYPGNAKNALTYDRRLIRRHGQSRSTPKYAERLGKKYAWIGLARLSGVLSDNAQQTKDSWRRRPGQDGLQGLDLRTIDPTDYSGDSSETIDIKCIWSLPSGRRASDARWLEGQDFPKFSVYNQEWVVLASSAGDRFDVDDGSADANERHYRRSDNHAIARLVAGPDLAKLRGVVRTHTPRLDRPQAHDIFVGEYPDSMAFRHLESEVTAEWPLGTIVLTNVCLDIGRSREYDCSSDDRPDLWVPVPDIIRSGGLRWDGNRSWVDVDGNCRVTHVADGEAQALLIRRDFISKYLTDRGLAIFWVVFQSKMIVSGFSGNGGQHEQTVLYVPGRERMTKITCKSTYIPGKESLPDKKPKARPHRTGPN